MVLVFVVAFQAGIAITARTRATPPPGHHTFFHGRTGCVQGVFDAGLLLFHFDLGGGADLDHRDTAGQLGNPLLQFLAIVIGEVFSI